MATGIEVRHTRGSATREGGRRCNCRPTYRASVWNPRERKLVRKSFRTAAEAKGWRVDAETALRRGELRSGTRTTVGQAAEALLAGMKDGTVLDRSGKPYKPATCRSYAHALRKYVVPELGAERLSSVARRDVQAAVDKWRAAGLAPATIHNKLDPLRVIFRRAIRRDALTVDPTANLELPSVRGGRDRIESPERASQLIAALPDRERAFWAMAFHTGLRRRELRALRWRDVDFEARVVRVERGWDDTEGPIEVKTQAGRRAVPLTGDVRRELAAHKLRTGRDGDDLVFGRSTELPFVPSTIRSRAHKAWEAASLEPLTPHEARHCAVSYFIAAGLNPKEISFVGHADVRQTWNRYGHLMPGGEQEAAGKLDSFFAAGKRRENPTSVPAVESGP